jgi:UDPglucose 6-dehydrogenase
VADYWEMVVKINEYQKERFVRNIIETMFNTVVDKKIAMFGFAFKANTTDTRESPGIHIAKKLIEEKALLSITDPKALENAKIDLAGIDRTVVYEPDPYKAAEDASAIVLVTEWEIFKTLDYKSILKKMKKPPFIFDGRNILNHRELFDIGFNVYAVGKPSLNHFD